MKAAEDGIIIAENLLKQKNYQTQFVRLNKALTNQFYLEAIFIAYAIIEDRTEAILRYEGKQIRDNRFVSLDRKLRKIKGILQDKSVLCGKYLQSELLEQVGTWKEARNRKMHALMKGIHTTEELSSLAEEGKALARALCTGAGNYKRAVERKRKREAI